ncbi:MAG TPA: tRNA pseudouridine(13) synthase TruD [Pseudomonadales bacterium]
MFKVTPADFRVTELPETLAAAGGEHLYLRLEKTGLATADVARWLAASFRVTEAAVGYAGLKDKHAVTEQWFSVQTPLPADALPSRDGIRLHAALRRPRKLRRGELGGNRFRVCLRGVTGDGWQERLAAVTEQGVPNYFGPQRFGGDNLQRAREWLARRPRGGPRDFRRGLHLSVLRSFLFNEVLAARVACGSWNRLIDGDAAIALPGPEGAEGPPVPTGPLWGRGRSPATGAALEIEQAALAAHAQLRDGLEHAGLSQDRRSLVLKPFDVGWEQSGTDLELGFTLPPGGYATSLLAEVFDLVPGSCR